MMTNDIKNTLDDLEATLTRLEKHTLPIETRAALHDVKKRLLELRSTAPGDVENNRLAALYRVSQSLGVSLHLDDVLTQVMDAVIELTGAERGFLMLVEPDTGDLNLRAARNIERETLQREDMEVSRTVIENVVETGEGVVTTDAQNDPRFAGKDSVVFYNLRSILCAPLRARGQTIGVIYVDNTAQSGIFTSEELELLTTFATQAAVAIENARLYTRTDQALAARVAELETLNQIDQDLNERLDLNHVLEITRHWAITGTVAAQGWVALRDEETNTLYLVPGSEDDLVPAPVETALASITGETSSKVIAIEEDSQTYLLAPVFHGGEIIAALTVAQDTPFPDSAREFLGRLAGHASAAIQNARLHQVVHEANEAKSQFVSIVTHELRIPLTSIKGYTDLIRQKAVGEINEQQLSFLNIIRNNVERMATLISDLSDISRIERGKLRLEPKSLPLHDHVEETLSGLRHRLEVKSQSLETDIPDNLPNVYADPNRLVQVLTNLISNAWKYTPAEGHIIVRARQEEQIVHIAIIDNGIGISQEEQEKLFTQFFRSENPAVREVTGWGLGLNVTKRLVEIMDGDIGFESTFGEGSTFWFTLPVAGEEEEEEEEI